MSAKKIVILGCVVLAMVFLVSVVCLDAYYRTNRPFEPRPLEGRIYATELSKGLSVYLTSRERTVYKLLMPSGASLLVIGVVLNFYWKQFPSHPRTRASE